MANIIEFTLMCFGLCSVLYLLINFLCKLRTFLRVYVYKSYPNFSKYGKWSVITGSTDGIGKALAFQLASRKQNIVLMARNKEKLEQVAAEIAAKHHVEVKYLQIDFTRDRLIYEEIEDFLKHLDIGSLINNVGIAMPPLEFLDVPDLSCHLRDICRVNMFSLCKMIQIVLPGMVKRKRGLILNISSSVSLAPLYSTYGATKAFSSHLSEVLSYEYADKGITIQTCTPCAVATKMMSGIPKNMMNALPLPDTYAASLLSTVGKERTTAGYWKHAIMCWFILHLPTTFTRKMLLAFEETRRKAYKLKHN